METDHGVLDCEMKKIPEVAVNSDEPEDYRLLFGWLKIRPKGLQGLLSPKWALFWLCWAGAVQGEWTREFIV